MRGFNDPRAVLDYLHGRSGSDPERDGLLGELVGAAKTPDRAGQLAQTLLWLAFWPGLTGLLRRVLVSSTDERDEVAAELAEKFAVVVGSCDPGAVTKVAATILLNTRREFWEALRFRAEERATEVPLDSVAEQQAATAPRAEVAVALADL